MIELEKYKSSTALNTAVLFLVFNRLDNTKEVFNAIKNAKPKRFYIAADGARANKLEETEKVKEVRDYITQNIDWECEVKTLFRSENLGCKYAVSEAIDWFFENEENGIILEDDCLPSQSFFWYCEELLEKYKDDMRVWHISGNNFNFGWQEEDAYSYSFGGVYGSIWGWATWRSRWNLYDIEMKNYDYLKSTKLLDNCYDGSKGVKNGIIEFEWANEGLDTWDYQWFYCRWINNGLTIIPNVNLVKNLGFGSDATHTFDIYDKRGDDMNNYDIKLPLKHPDFVIRDRLAELKHYNDYMRKKTVLRKIINKLSQMFIKKSVY